MNVFDTLKERGFIEQTTHEDEIRELFNKEKVTFYIGYDPTADSLTIGHFLTVMAMMHLQRAGHRPIALVGGGTGMVGDPTDRSDMRRIMTVEEIDHNLECFKKQLSKYIEFGEDKAIMVNNADWLRELKYVDFLREVGVHFSVNRMLAADCFKSRMEKGLSFLEFNYMLMQSYDFLELYRRYNCKIQLGGNDQWSNIISGAGLVRRVDQGSAYGMTFCLLTNFEGKKMGKTQKGAIWLDEDKTSPYEFYQYWRNVDDKDVEKCLSLMTFLPMDEVRRLSALTGSDINEAKEVLAFEVTKIVHDEVKAKEAMDAARGLFSGGGMEGSIPTTDIHADELIGMDIITLLTTASLSKSKSDARRLIAGGGVKVNDNRIDSIEYTIGNGDIIDGVIMVQKGKKGYQRVRVI